VWSGVTMINVLAGEDISSEAYPQVCVCLESTRVIVPDMSAVLHTDKNLYKDSYKNCEKGFFKH